MHHFSVKSEPRVNSCIPHVRVGKCDQSPECEGEQRDPVFPNLDAAQGSKDEVVERKGQRRSAAPLSHLHST